MLDQAAQDRVRDAIRTAEAGSELEFVTVLARQSDGYYFIPTLWAALIALFLPVGLVWTPFWLDVSHVVLIQLLVFSVLTALFRWTPVMYRLIPKRVLHHRASNMAHRQFLAQGVHRTRDGTGVLLFVSEAEHYVEIIADSGIDQKVEAATWQQIVDQLTEAVRGGEVEAGFVEAIRAVGRLGADIAPSTRAKDELPNHLVLI